MLIGKDCWDTSITYKMETRKIHNRSIYTFHDLAHSPYEMLCATTLKFANKIAFYDDLNKSYSYQTFLSMVDELATYLYFEKKVKKQDHVGLLLHNSIEFCVAFYAIAKLGAVCVPFPSKYRENEVIQLIDKANLSHLLYSEDFEYCSQFEGVFSILKSIDEKNGYGFRHLVYLVGMQAPSDYNLNDKIIIMFTSGTTSQSKGVVLRNYNVMHAVMAYERLLDIKSWDKTIIPIPIYHITGLVALLNLFVFCGGTIYLYRKYDAKQILECIEKHQITFMHGSPTVFSKLLEYKEQYPNMKSLRMLGCGSSYTPVEKQKEFHKWLPHTKFLVIYGMTETSSPALIHANDTPTSIYSKAAGKPIPGVEIKIMEGSKECTTNEVGEIWIRGSVVCEEYYHMKSDAIDEENWLNTGDMG